MVSEPITGRVSVVIDDRIVWAKESGPESGGGFSSRDGRELSDVLSLLAEATGQVIAELRALQDSQPISNAGGAAAHIDHDVPITAMRCPDRRGASPDQTAEVSEA